MKKNNSQIVTERPRIVADLFPGNDDFKRQVREFRLRLLRGIHGGVCAKCGTNHDQRPLEFHHTSYPGGGGYGSVETLGSRVGKVTEDVFWDELIPEVRDLCILVCHPCHMGGHRKKREKS